MEDRRDTMMPEYPDDTEISINFDITHMPPLQDITMNQTTYLGSGTNPRSPGKVPNGTASGHAGRTIKDYEDQLGILQKENFNLKLRVYFLEEKMGISSADENTIKKNIELNVELESLKKDLVEKQELLSQAAKAFQLHEEQKEAAARNQAQYQESLEAERRRIEDLEQELSDYKEKFLEPSMYYKEAFGITPEAALENKDKLVQMEKYVESLDAEIKQLSSSLEDERSWALGLEAERDALRIKLETEVKNREKLTSARDNDIEELRTRIKQLEEEALRRESVVQQYKNELAEKDRLIREKISILEEKSHLCDELSEVADKRKKQIDQLRMSVKSRDDALTDLNNKHRALLNQSENSLARRLSPPSSPSMYEGGQRVGQASGIASPVKCTSPFEWDCRSRSFGQMQGNSGDEKDLKELTKELEERDRKLKDQEETKKQLMLKLCNVQETAEITQKELKKVKGDYQKALQAIQEFVSRQDRLEQKLCKKEKKIEELKQETNRIKDSESRTKKITNLSSVKRNLTLEMDEDSLDKKLSNQQRFEEMEIKINDLRDEIDTIKAEKNRLEKQIQDESEELRDQISDKQRRIDCLELERDDLKRQLEEKTTEMNLITSHPPPPPQISQELVSKTLEIAEKDRKIEELSKELQIKTQNLQKLVNTELWSKNKEIAKLHNHMTANNPQEKSRNKSEFPQDSTNSHFDNLIKELNEIGIEVKFSNDLIHLVSRDNSLDLKNLNESIQKLVINKSELEKEVEYLKWLKLITKTDKESENDSLSLESEKSREYCDLLREHLKSLVKFMKETLKSSNYSINDEYKRMVLDLLVGSNILSEDFVHALEGVNSLKKRELTLEDLCTCREFKRNRSNMIDDVQVSEKSDSEAFSEPDRSVSLARMGIEIPEKSTNRSRYNKYSNNLSDSEDSVDYVPYHKTYQSDLNEIDSSHHINELKETHNLLYSELMELRNDLLKSSTCDVDEKLKPIIIKLERSQNFCDKLQSSFDKKIQDSLIKKDSKQNSVRKVQLEKKIVDVENMAIEIAKQKSELLKYKENNERKTAELMMEVTKENEGFKARVRKLEEENDIARGNILMLTKELDRLTLSHSQVLVDNTKLTNDKLRLEQEIRKGEERFDVAVKSLKDKFEKEVRDLNQVNEGNRGRMHELEVANKELRRQVVVCEASDSAPSSSGISSIPNDGILKQRCDDLMQEFHYNGSQYWHPLNYPPSTGRSKSSCSPDLGIESDAAVSTTRPLKDTLKITESMTNLLSDEENCNNRGLRDLDRESPLHIEGLDEVEALKQENEALKRRLMKTKRALEDTFKHLSASNKNKKNVEKAITKQLMITKSILQKTRTYEEPFDN